MSNPGWPHAHADTDFNNNSNYTYSHHDHAQFPHHKPPPHGQTSSFSPSPLSHPTDTTTSSPAPPACSHLNPDPRPLRTYLLRTTITIAFLLAIFGLIKVYANMTVIDDQQKLIFNMAVILLTLWVGVNMTVCPIYTYLKFVCGGRDGGREGRSLMADRWANECVCMWGC